jgi:hypothetical protein
VVSTTVAFETFTPGRAQAILASCNLNNRTIRWKRVKTYAAAMMAGQWIDTGESIKFDVEGRLIDGQHRLLACIMADMPMSVMVVRGLPVEAFKAIDNGLPRKTSDVVQSSGIGNSVAVSSSARMVLRWRSDCLRDGSKEAKLVTRADILEFVDVNRDVIALAVTKSRAKASRAWRINPTAICAVAIELYLAERRDKFDEFYDSLVSGENLRSGDPRLTLIKWAAQAPRTFEVASDHLWACVRAWNAWAQGEELKQIKIWTGAMPKLFIPAG